MALQNLKESLENEGKAEAKKIIAAAQKLADEEIEKAKVQAKKTVAAARARANEIAKANERISAAQLKAKRRVSEAMNAKADEALARIWAEFSKLPEGRSYEKFMKAAISQAEKEFSGKAAVYTNERDQKVARKFSKNVAADTLNIAGGAIVRTPDGKITIDNSLESIFESKKGELSNIVYSELMKK
ncbi:MAG TPA: hypothetical protein HA254_07700 [Candidatus Diapherotrites archaeon]|uniref:A-type ATP synthase subunit E n=1 Tax=Candidatus Iainarchaeum sp. TaxID=3101447 RepID=A0A7J4J058_9ARCH|nr:hypothetical protein [Candidatus Diapherotrites archaeon]